MKRFRIIAASLSVVAMFAILSCNEPLQIGTELLETGDVNFVNTDTISVQALTTALDSTIAYQSPNFIFPSHRIGWVSDPIFGSHRSELVAQLIPESFSKPEGTIDSVVLYIGYDTLGVYGDDNSTYDLSVLELDESISRSGTYYVDFDPQVSTLHGSATGLSISEADSIEIVEIQNGVLDTMRVPNRMHFNLNTSLGVQLFDIDSVNYTTTDSFFQAFKGIVIRPTSMNGAMLSSLSTQSKISVFYNNSTTGLGQFDYFLGGAAFSAHLHDYSTGSIDGSIDNEVLSQDLLYVQGAGGPSLSVKFPFLPGLSDIVVNEAILELTTELLPQDNRGQYPLPKQLYTAHKEDSTYVLTRDVSRAFQQFGDIELFGGLPLEITSDGTTRTIYRLNLSEHIQGIISGEVSNEIIIQLSQNASGVERAIFKGINDSDQPIKLKITYTEI